MGIVTIMTPTEESILGRARALRGSGDGMEIPITHGPTLCFTMSLKELKGLRALLSKAMHRTTS